MDDWSDALQSGGSAEAAWDRFIERYRRLIFATIRHYAEDYDDVMDIFAHVCEALRRDDLRRLRTYFAEPEHRARFSTWLVAVVRNLTIDWFRQRDGRRRLSAFAERLSPLRQQIFQHVFVSGASHLEAYELIHSRNPSALPFREFLSELRATYEAVRQGRRGHLLAELAYLPPPEDRPSSDPTELPDRAKWLGRALKTLSPESQLAIQLYVVEELPAADVARILGLPNAKAVHNRVYRALDALRLELARSGFGPEDF